MRHFVQRAPNGGAVAFYAQVAADRSAADADRTGFFARNFFDRRAQFFYDRRIDRCCGRLHCLLFAEFDFYAVCLFDFIHALAGFGAHFVERVAGQNAAVHVKHVFAGNRVDVRHVRFFFCRLEC